MATDAFEEVYKGVADLTIVDRGRCEALFRLSRHAATLPGDIAELGVYKGGTCLLLARANPHKMVHAFDTFTGLPNADPAIDGYKDGEFAAAATDVRPALLAAGIVVHEGVFPESARALDCSFCFAHFDADTYQSARDFLQFFYPRLVTGGVLVFDDFGDPACKGVERAIEEWVARSTAWPVKTQEHQCMLFRAI